MHVAGNLARDGSSCSAGGLPEHQQSCLGEDSELFQLLRNLHAFSRCEFDDGRTVSARCQICGYKPDVRSVPLAVDVSPPPPLLQLHEHTQDDYEKHQFVQRATTQVVCH